MTATRRLRRLGTFALAAALATIAAACGGSDNSPSTAPSVVVGPQTALFEGTLPVGGSAFYSFNVQETGDALVMLASVATSTAPGTSTNSGLGLGIGTPLGTDCTETKSLVAFPLLQSPLVSNLTPGIYCVRVYDVGTLAGSVNFAIRIVHT
jgi:hypothetical protein